MLTKKITIESWKIEKKKKLVKVENGENQERRKGEGGRREGVEEDMTLLILECVINQLISVTSLRKQNGE